MLLIKFKFDENIFKNIQDVNFIYYLGFLWVYDYNSNNSNYSIEMTIKNEDFLNIKHIFKNMKGIEFSYTDRIRDCRKTQKCIRVNSKSFCDFLRMNDYNEKNNK